MGLFFVFLFWTRKINGLSPMGRGRSCSVRFDLTRRPYSQDQVEKSFSYCGTSFQTPFSFLLVMVISCGWYR
jgi:hypothetical protein